MYPWGVIRRTSSGEVTTPPRSATTASTGARPSTRPGSASCARPFQPAVRYSTSAAAAGRRGDVVEPCRRRHLPVLDQRLPPDDRARGVRARGRHRARLLLGPQKIVRAAYLAARTLSAWNCP